ncbi:MAG TPA: branched-chain amino acid ABC transporter permease [bacterium]|nr:branched-chain amino acid ABC transporter permease [bacterium]
MAIYLCLVGVVETFRTRWVVADAMGLGQAFLLVIMLAAGYVAARRTAPAGWLWAMIEGAGGGLLAGASLAVLLLVGSVVNVRTIFINASPTLYALLSVGLTPSHGSLALLGVGAIAGACGAIVFLVPPAARRTLLWGVFAVLVLSIFQDLLQLLLQPRGVASAIRDLLFTADGPSLRGAGGVFILTLAVSATWTFVGRSARDRAGRLAPRGRHGLRGAGIALALAGLLLVPIAGGPFVAQVMVLVGLYILMGLGLNLEVGFAGLLDLGFVAFFAIGAYTVALLTSRGEHGIAHLSFWAAIPVAIAVSLVAGVIFGVPVLRVRGDYLAIATLGLGEIVRLLVLSDALGPWLGGSFGVLGIPKPVIAGWELSGPRQLYYLTAVASALIAYVAWRLQDSRLGRAWMAIREDEDVAQAIGINLISTKLLAYGIGGAMGGIGGAIFAVMLGSVFPHSFQLLISINVLVLIILGGMGSIWGVIVGALVLIGLPELLREFGEFRFLIYGVVLVVMMLYRPEGLLPAAAQKLELHAEEAAEPDAAGAVVPGGAAGAGGRGGE